MGVDRTDYLMFGAKVDYDLFGWDKHEDMINGVPGSPFDMVADSMSGKYLMVGKIIATSDPYAGIEFTEITDDMLPKDIPELTRVIEESLGAEIGKMKLYLFSHFS